MGVRRLLVLLLLAACRAPDAPVAPVDGNLVGPPPDASIPTGTAHVLLTGTVVTPDTVIDGAVLVEGDTITCVDTVDACSAMPGAAGATVLATGGVIAPGLIDTHNHILFDVFDGTDWLPSKLYQDHDQWPSEPRYIAMLDVKQCLANDSQGKPTWCANTPYGTATGNLRCEMDKWGELKGLVAGTTSIVGLPGTSAACFGSLARSIDVAQNELPDDTVQTSALFPPSNPDGVCANFAAGKTTAFLAHVGEGTDAKAAGELAKLGASTTTPNCLFAPQTAITHGVAFSAADFATMAQNNMKLIWSPQSNITLYNATANIPAALDAGVAISLAPDWSMGGSQNLLDELRFADAYDDANFGNRLAAKDLVAMATSHPAAALAVDSQLGTLAPGKLADLAVFTGDVTAPYDTILAAKPAQVALVMVGGTILYGDTQYQTAAPGGCETIDVCGASKMICVAASSQSDKLDQTFASSRSTDALEKAMTDADAQTPTDGFDFAPLAPLVSCN